MELTLPGGISAHGTLQRRARFLPLTGNIEQALVEFGSVVDSPEYVSRVLSSVLETIGDREADIDCVSELCVADRQYLMLRLAAMLGGEQLWIKAGCGSCSADFDVEVKRSDLPVKQAGEDFPSIRFQLRHRTIVARIPSGSDQQQLYGLSDDEALMRLLQNCITSVDDEAPSQDFFDGLSESDIDLIDEALDQAAPAVCNQLIVKCPECGEQQCAELDHYLLDGIDEYLFYDEVHMLASHYHWSEADILDLPQSRRRLYLDLINRARGMVTDREIE